MDQVHHSYSPAEAEQPDSPSSNSTSDVFHDTASCSGRDAQDHLGLEHEAFFDAEDLGREDETTERSEPAQAHQQLDQQEQQEQAQRDKPAGGAVAAPQPQEQAASPQQRPEPEIEEIPSDVSPLPSLQERKQAAEEHKQKGNQLFAAGHYGAAVDEYSQALDVAHEDEPSRAVYFANRAACRLKLKQLEEAAQDCTHATNIDQGYLKAWIRRCTAYEQLNQYERALGDAKKVVELDPGNASAQQNVQRLTPLAQQEQERMKDEMIGKLKDLGNTVLGKFGMSLDNFNAVKDPNTGSYSINFNQG